MTKFKVGDLVRLKKNLKSGKMYDDFTLYPSMKFDGLKPITEIVGMGSVRFKDNPYYYRPCMLTKSK